MLGARMTPVHICEGTYEQNKLTKIFFLPIESNSSDSLLESGIQGCQPVNVFFSTMSLCAPLWALEMQQFSACSTVVSQCFLLGCWWWYILNLSRKCLWKVSQRARRALFFLPAWSLNRFGTETSRGAVVLSAPRSNQRIARAQAITTTFPSLLLPGDKLQHTVGAEQKPQILFLPPLKFFKLG